MDEQTKEELHNDLLDWITNYTPYVARGFIEHRIDKILTKIKKVDILETNNSK